MAIKQRIVPDDYADIATALGAANSGDEIIALESGSPYTGANNRGLDPGGLDPLLIRSQWNEEHCTIDPETNNRAFLFDNGESRNVILDGFEIQNGSAGVTDGGGILVSLSSDPTIRNCIVKDSHAGGTGGGIAIDTTSSPLIQNVLVFDCSAAATGGGISSNGSTPDLINVTLSNNTADVGGGLALIGAGANTVNMDNSIIWGNTGTSNANEIYLAFAANTLNLNYSCYGNAAGDVVNNGTFNITACTTSDPLFVTGRFGDYCISQTTAGQASDSPCLNTGTGNARDNWLYLRTTRSDEFADVGVVDMGYHYVGVYVSGIPEGVMTPLRWKPMHVILEIDELAVSAVSAPGERLDLRKKVGLAVTVMCDFDVDGTSDLVVHVIASQDDDDHGGYYDSEDYATIVVPVDPGETVQKTVAVNAGPRFIKVFAENEDDTYTITNIVVQAAPLGTEELRDEEMVHYDWR